MPPRAAAARAQGLAPVLPAPRLYQGALNGLQAQAQGAPSRRCPLLLPCPCAPRTLTFPRLLLLLLRLSLLLLLQRRAHRAQGRGAVAGNGVGVCAARQQRNNLWQQPRGGSQVQRRDAVALAQGRVRAAQARNAPQQRGCRGGG